MKPTHALLAEDFFPVNIAHLQLRHCRVPSIRAADSAANAEASFSKVQSVTYGSADAVVFDPTHMRLIYASLKHQILHEPAHLIVRQRRHNRRLHSEASFQSAGNAVLTSTLPDQEGTRVRHPAIAGIKAQHYFAEAH